MLIALLILGIVFVFFFFVKILGRCPVCWSDRFVYESVDRGPVADRNPNRKIIHKVICDNCQRTLSFSWRKASKPAP